jgi:hypothetical protein
MNTEKQDDTPESEEPPEPFATLSDLVEEHGLARVLQDLSTLAECISDEHSCTKGIEATRLHLELTQLLERMDGFMQIVDREPEPGNN